MSLLRAHPFFGAFAPELRSAFRLLDEPIGAALARFVPDAGRPLVDVKEQEDRFSIVAEVPGYKRDEVKVEFTGEDGRTLVISGEHKSEGASEPTAKTVELSTVTGSTAAAEQQNTSWLTERYTGSFSRSFRLPQPIDIEQVRAKMSDGVLQLELPKATKMAPRSITVE